MMEGALDQELGYDLERVHIFTVQGDVVTWRAYRPGQREVSKGKVWVHIFFLFTNVSFWLNPSAHGVSVYLSKIIIDFVKCEIAMITVAGKVPYSQSYGFSSSHVWR